MDTLTLAQSNVLKNRRLQDLEDILDENTVLGSSIATVQIDGEIITTRYILLTPELAEHLLLNHNNCNRPLSRINTEFLTKELQNGRWKFNAETISINSNGDLSDGQHRCQAVFITGVPIITLCTSNLSLEAFSTINIGRKRAGSDILAVNGVKNASIASSTVKSIFGFKNSKFSANRNSNRTLTNTEVFDYYKSLNNIDSHIDFAMSLYHQTDGFLNATTIGTFSYLISEKNDNQMVVEFLTKLCKGVGIDENSSIYALRNKILQTKTNKNYKLTNEELYKNICYAWSKHKNKISVKKHLRLPDDYIANID
jgi:hypothetical protein